MRSLLRPGSDGRNGWTGDGKTALGCKHSWRAEQVTSDGSVRLSSSPSPSPSPSPRPVLALRQSAAIVRGKSSTVTTAGLMGMGKGTVVQWASIRQNFGSLSKMHHVC